MRNKSLSFARAIKNRSIGKILDSWFQRFSMVDKKVGLFPQAAWLLRSLFSSRFRKHRSLRRFCFMNNQKFWEPLNIDNRILPSVELLVLAKESDFEILNLVVEYAVLNSVNPISNVRIVVPRDSMPTVNSLFKEDKVLFSLLPVIDSDDSFISESEISKIVQVIPGRLGWVKQQVIANRAIQESESDWVLLVDADTILLKPRMWINELGEQILLPSEEFHDPYYDFLKTLSNDYKDAKNSFVSHHMIYNVKSLREIMARLGGISEVLDKALSWSIGKGESPFDLKYEIYAQYIYASDVNRVRLEKWGNVSYDRRNFSNMDKLKSELEILRNHYCSVSYHHWNVRDEF